MMLIATVAVGSMMSVPEKSRSEVAVWWPVFSRVGRQLQDDIGWFLPSLLATMLSFYLFMVGEELAKVDEEVRRRRRLILGFVATLIAGSGAAVSGLVILYCSINPADWPNAIPVLTVGTLVVGFGAAVGSFEVEPDEVRRRAVEVERQRTLRAMKRLTRAPLTLPRQEILVCAAWIVLITVVGYIALHLSTDSSNPFAGLSLLPIALASIVPVFGVTSAATAYRFFHAYRYSGKFVWLIFVCLCFVVALVMLSTTLIGGKADPLGTVMTVQCAVAIFIAWFPFHQAPWLTDLWTVNRAMRGSASRVLTSRLSIAEKNIKAIDEDDAKRRTVPHKTGREAVGVLRKLTQFHNHLSSR